MTVPLAIAAPAAVASLAYLNARLSLSYDARILSTLVTQSTRAILRQRKDRVNAFYVLEGHAFSRGTADKVFFMYQGRTWTYKQTYDTVLRYGTWLKQTHDVKPREIIAIDFMNCHHFIFLWYGLWSIGAIPAFMNYNLTGKPLLHCLKTSTTRLVFIDENVRSTVTPEVLKEMASPQFRENPQGPIEAVFFTSELEQHILSTEPIRAPDDCRAGVVTSDMAILIFTSGTTGFPKAAIVSWSKPTMGASFFHGFVGWKKDDIMYTCMPLYHSSASILALSTALMGGRTIAIGHKFSTKTFWKDVRESKATLIQYVGETCRYLLSAPPEIDPNTGENLDKKNSVRLAVGNGLRPDVWNRFKERFGIEAIVEFYAATEGTSGSWNHSRNDFAAGAIGRNGTIARLALGSTLAIVELDYETEEPWRDPKTGFCKKVATGEPGELLYRVDPKDIGGKFQGYFGNKSASQKKILRDVLVKGDAFFRTGDLVRWDAEGRWYFNDRLGDTFRWKGENVSTSEVSECLGRHDAVQEANVYGVQLPKHDGRAGMAAVVFGQAPDPKVMGSVATHTVRNLPRYATPLFLRVMRSMQMTGTNKQQKTALRNDGVDPGKMNGDVLYWLRDGQYVPFTDQDWEALKAGRVKL